MRAGILSRIRNDRRRAEDAFARAKSREAERADSGLAPTFELIQAVDRLAYTLHFARSRLGPQDPELVELESYCASLFHDFVHQAKHREKTSFFAWIREYREITQRNLELAGLVAAVFVGTTLLGWVVARQMPEYTQALVDVPFLERIIQNREWFSSLNENPQIGGLQIAANNIKVAFLCFVAGSLFGLGGLLIMAFNGLMLGAMLGFAATHGFDDTMVTFISGHGPLELSVIVMATFSGALFGRAWVPPWHGMLGRRLRAAAGEAFAVVAGVVPWLVLAALIEAFVSPVPGIPLSFKVGLGAVIAAFFWAVTLWPVRPASTP